MRKVSDILTRKGNKLFTVLPSMPVIYALRLMAENNIGCVVVAEERNFLGIMTERDYSRKIILKGKSSTNTTVSEIMSPDFPYVTAEDTIEHCMELLSRNNLRYLPVIHNNILEGVISINDVVTETIASHEDTISHLQSYIAS